MDIEGEWSTFNGLANINQDKDGYEGMLFLAGDSEPYHHMKLISENGDDLVATLYSPGKDTPPFQLKGNAYLGETKEGEELGSIVLTDGTTVLGLAKGPHTGEGNAL